MVDDNNTDNDIDTTTNTTDKTTRTHPHSSLTHREDIEDTENSTDSLFFIDKTPNLSAFDIAEQAEKTGRNNRKRPRNESPEKKTGTPNKRLRPSPAITNSVIGMKRNWIHHDIPTSTSTSTPTSTSTQTFSMPIRVMSYNILSNRLLLDHKYLYSTIPSAFIRWPARRDRILQMIQQHNPDLLALQEVEFAEYSETFIPWLESHGYKSSYRMRGGDKIDGLVIAFKTSKFRLKQTKYIDYYHEGHAHLNRDNVALIALLEVIEPNTTTTTTTTTTTRRKKNEKNEKNEKQDEIPRYICFATTHLVFNPKAGFAKTHQLATLFGKTSDFLTNHHQLPDPANVPVIFTGDFNLTPNSYLYNFITHRRILFDSEKLDSRSLSGQNVKLSNDAYEQWYEFYRNVVEDAHSVKESDVTEINSTLVRDKRGKYSVTLPHGGIILENPFVLSSVYDREITRNSSTTGTALTSTKHPLPPMTKQRFRNLNKMTTTSHSSSSSCVDYIFYGHHAPTTHTNSRILKIRPLKYLDGIPTIDERNWKDEMELLPNAFEPSDHVCVVCDMVLEER